MSQMRSHLQEQEAAGGGMLGTSEEAQKFGQEAFVTGHGATKEQQQLQPQRGAEAAAPPSSALAGGGVGGGERLAGERGAQTTTTTTPTTTAGPTASKMSLAPFADAPEGVQAVISAVSGIFAARGMAETCGVVGPYFARDVVADTPFAFTHRKGEMRVGIYLGSLFFASPTRFRPAFVEWGASGYGSSAVEITGEMVLAPRRTLLFPPSLLLPRELKFRATVVCGVRGDVDKASTGLIEYVRFRAHNLPVPPAFLRGAIGGNVASALHTLEPLWSQAAGLWGEDFYAHRQQQRARGVTGGGAGYGGVTGYGGAHYGAGAGAGVGGAIGAIGAAAHDTSNAAIDFGSAVVNRAAEYLGYFATTARHAAESVLPSALVGGAGHPRGARAAGAGYGMTTGAGTTTGAAVPSAAAMGGGRYGGGGYGAGTTMGLGGGGYTGGGEGLTGYARDVAAKGSDVAHKAAAKVGEAAGACAGAARKTAAGAGMAGGPATTGAVGTGSTYAAAAAAPEAGGARRRERGGVTGSAY